MAFEFVIWAGRAVVQNQKHGGEVVYLATTAIFVRVFTVLTIVNIAGCRDGHTCLFLRCYLSSAKLVNRSVFTYEMLLINVNEV